MSKRSSAGSKAAVASGHCVHARNFFATLATTGYAQTKQHEKRCVIRRSFDGRSTRGKVIDGPFAETREMVAGFSIWEVKDLDEAMAWAMKAPVMPGMAGGMEIRPFYEAADLGAFLSPEELANAKRPGERGKLGVA